MGEAAAARAGGTIAVAIGVEHRGVIFIAHDRHADTIMIISTITVVLKTFLQFDSVGAVGLFGRLTI